MNEQQIREVGDIIRTISDRCELNLGIGVAPVGYLNNASQYPTFEIRISNGDHNIAERFVATDNAMHVEIQGVAVSLLTSFYNGLFKYHSLFRVTGRELDK